MKPLDQCDIPIETSHWDVSTNVHAKSILKDAESHLSTYFKSLDEIEEHNFNKVLNALTECRVGEEHFSWVSGYGHDDLGREKIDQVFSQIFNTESAIVRPHFASGTHAISCCLFGCLRPGDELVSVVGTPYDTLHSVIGITPTDGSLIDFGVTYKEIPLNENKEVDLSAIPKYISSKTKVALIQRSKGYENRKCLSMSDVEKVISTIKKTNKNIICFVDNCFGEFTEKLEPTDVGADLTCGSLIKNLGGGIVPAGGYIAGRKELVAASACRLTAPGIGSAGGCMFDLSRLILQGLFFAPKSVIEVLKGISLTSYFFEKKGFQVNPKPTEHKSDIVVAISLGKKEYVEKVCKMVQANSPINSHLTPISCELPGYEDEVIMAGGTFIEGSTIELSCDAPIREPFTLYWQGGLSYFHTKAVLSKIEI